MPDARPLEVAGANDGGSELTSPAPFRFSLRMLLCGIGVFACAAGALAWLHQVNLERERQQKRRMLEDSIPALLEQVGIAMHNYGGVHLFDFAGNPKDRSWPPAIPLDDAGKPTRSWRLEIAGAIICNCQDALGPMLDLPWDAPHNIAFAKEMGTPFTLEKHEVDAHVFGITGPGSAFDKNVVSHYYELPDQVVVAMEIRDSNAKPMQPGDYDVTELLALSGRIGDHLHGLLPDRLHVLFADGEVWALSNDTPMTALHPLLTIAGAKTHDREELLAPHCVAKRVPLRRQTRP